MFNLVLSFKDTYVPSMGPCVTCVGLYTHDAPPDNKDQTMRKFFEKKVKLDYVYSFCLTTQLMESFSSQTKDRT